MLKKKLDCSKSASCLETLEFKYATEYVSFISRFSQNYSRLELLDSRNLPTQNITLNY